jgi:hypothetical protein
MSHKKHNAPATISQLTKCVKKNMHNVQINLNVNPNFEQGTDFKVYREMKPVEIETSIASKSINEDKFTLLYKHNEVIDIPRKLNEHFDNKLDTNYYIYGVPKEDSFFHSLLYIISKEFKLKPIDVRLNYVKTLKETMTNKVPSIFKTHGYSKYEYKRGEIIDNIENTATIAEGLLCLASDYFGINLIVLNYDSEKYWMGKEYDDSINEKNVVIIYTNGMYLPLIHIYGALPDNFIYKCIVNRFKIYNKLATQKELSVVEQEVAKKTPTPTPTPGTPVLAQTETTPKLTLKGFGSYKLPELQTLATEHGIETTQSVNGKTKSKTKREMYDALCSL